MNSLRASFFRCAVQEPETANMQHARKVLFERLYEPEPGLDKAPNINSFARVATAA
jgi:hypothetical protein